MYKIICVFLCLTLVFSCQDEIPQNPLLSPEGNFISTTNSNDFISVNQENLDSLVNADVAIECGGKIFLGTNKGIYVYDEKASYFISHFTIKTSISSVKIIANNSKKPQYKGKACAS